MILSGMQEKTMPITTQDHSCMNWTNGYEFISESSWLIVLWKLPGSMYVYPCKKWCLNQVVKSPVKLWDCTPMSKRGQLSLQFSTLTFLQAVILKRREKEILSTNSVQVQNHKSLLRPAVLRIVGLIIFIYHTLRGLLAVPLGKSRVKITNI